MTVFGAMLVDAYRELNSKKLFWITLFLSGIVVVVYGSIGFNEDGMSMFYGLWDIENELIKKGSPVATLLYRTIFSSFIVGLWLAWIATILALISTTTIFPDFLAGGAVDLVLSKPIRRSSIFIMKYVSSLLFVLLQVGLFCIGVFFCYRWRLGEWNWMIFAAIPIVTVFYSYLYSVNVLVGIVTRSALTALLVTMLFWVSLFSLNFAEQLITQFRTQSQVIVEGREKEIEALAGRLDALDPQERTGPVGMRIEREITEQKDSMASAHKGVRTLGRWQGPIRWVQFVLPKTSETIALLDRWLKDDIEITLFDLLSGNIAVDDEGNYVPRDESRDREVALRMEDEYESRSWWYVLGTSIVFELLVLLAAGVLFAKRDF